METLTHRTYPPQRTLYCSRAWLQANCLYRRQLKNNGISQNILENDEERRKQRLEKMRKLILFHKMINHVSITLNSRGWILLKDFLGRERVHNVLDEVKSLYSTPGKFHDGQLVKPKNGSPTASVRSDKICWFDEKLDSHCLNIRFVVETVSSIVMRMAGIPCKLISRSKAMVSCYPGDGSRYVKHVDNPNSDGRGRRVTAIYYLNPDWKPKDGGQLRLYPTNSTTHFDIDPLADNLVLFWSDSRNPHEVLPAFAMRYAIVLWYFDDENENTHYSNLVTADKKEESVK